MPVALSNGDSGGLRERLARSKEQPKGLKTRPALDKAAENVSR